ncbi:uncharacterized protein TRIREDRAFT_4426 [Trichoderma reesei QM6a]|jgi:hypothetical protein|uniref:Predicted protein n=2 Tax=Hypocrea jecorina TaxID=51453 RepID=G0RLV2_HYPJQ|nr:uncharacterized protein TRIREDRAFT_4426 [Trichoderma reesei QM6a]EGR47682.1 predicted protein [Trichoderma reesei QM6a]ETS01154.1 hypothetical protein M419DRAFT_81411 [Trichoderma reesei RUT C-30]
MASTQQLFIAMLRSDHIKDCLFPHLATADLCAVRAASSACCNLVTKRLFTRIRVTFTAATFTRPARIAALGRIGHHIEHLTFHFAHSEATFLPPLVHPLTGDEIAFLYKPHTSMGSALTRPKYANTELGEILTQQYPPLFHAATNVPSFIYALNHIPNMRHLTIRCPGQDPRERYRRDIVDYALISLRIAVERAPMTKLNKLSLASLHPSAFNYLRYINGIGSVPSASRRWHQITKLHISVEAWDFYGPCPGLDHLKVMDDYIRNFAPGLEKLTFAWVGAKGPCPIALSADPLFAPPRSAKKLFHEVTSPMSPLPTRPPRCPIHFPKLRYLQIRNATMNSPQLKGLIAAHQGTVKQFGFESVVLANNGSWEEALAPVDGDDKWSRSSIKAPSDISVVTGASEEGCLPSPSAAVEAAGYLNSLILSDSERDVVRGMSTSDTPEQRDSEPSFSTKITRKRVRRRHRKHSKTTTTTTDSGDRAPDSPSPLSPPPSSHSNNKSLKMRFRFSSGSSQVAYSAIPEPLNLITSPIMTSEPQPVLLQPTIYSPSSHRQAGPDEGISTVQRNLEQEKAHRLFAEDADARASALHKAKEAVLAKLGKEFYNNNNNNSNKKERVADAASMCRYMGAREVSGCSGEMVIEDWRGLESRSALVPLMFSRT